MPAIRRSIQEHFFYPDAPIHVFFHLVHKSGSFWNITSLLQSKKLFGFIEHEGGVKLFHASTYKQTNEFLWPTEKLGSILHIFHKFTTMNAK